MRLDFLNITCYIFSPFRKHEFKFDSLLSLLFLLHASHLHRLPSHSFREIPAFSLRPPDSACVAEAPLTAIQSEGGLCDSCSSLGGPSSPCQLYHQVSAECAVCCLGWMKFDRYPLTLSEVLKYSQTLTGRGKK